MKFKFLFVCTLFYVQNALASSGFALGGDPFDIYLVRGQSWAVKILDTIELNLLSNHLDESQVSWIIGHVSELKNDIQSSLWTAVDRTNLGMCAETELVRNAPVFYNRDLCRQNGVTDVSVAAEIIIHESLHHFGKDEREAREISRAVMNEASNSQKLNDVLKIEAKLDLRFVDRWYWSQNETPMVWTYNSAKKTNEVYASIMDPGRVPPTALRDLTGMSKVSLDKADRRWDAVKKITDSSSPIFDNVFTTGSSFLWSGEQDDPKASHWIMKWGGISGSATAMSRETKNNVGYLYNTESQRLLVIPETNAPMGRVNASAVLLDGKAFYWGGQNFIKSSGEYVQVLNDGGLFNFSQQKWETLKQTDWVPEARFGHTMVSDGQKAYMWGGCAESSDYGVSKQACRYTYCNGAIFDIDTKSWQVLPKPPFQIGCLNHQAVWTGSKMIVWGGNSPQGSFYAKSGGIYDPKTQNWTEIKLAPGVLPRKRHKMLWTGKEIAIFGGFQEYNESLIEQSVLFFDPETQAWRTIRPLELPIQEENLSVVWTGLEFVLFYSNKSSATGMRTLFSYVVNPYAKN